MIYSQGFVPTITCPTRITETSSTCIDHIYTNNVISVLKSYILLHDLTDHLPIILNTNMQPHTALASTTFERDTKYFQMEAFNESLLENLNSIENDCILNPNVHMTKNKKRFKTKP